MKVSLITIGDEILIGQVVDTNAAWIARRLSDAGAVIAAKFTVGDTAAAITKALSEALQAAEVVIMTGGLGPTKDDITKKTLAGFMGTGMHEDESVLSDVREMLSRRGIEVNGLNRGQAMVPDGCRVLHNANGTAPGMWFEYLDKVIVSLPGVPFEMKALIDGQVLPLLKERFGQGRAVHVTVHTAGIAESVLAEKLTDWEGELPADIKLAYLPSTTGVRLRLSSTERPADEAKEYIGQKTGQLKNIIGPYLLEGEDNDPASSIARLLKGSDRTLSTAESCTGGYIASLITASEGASNHFVGSVVAYTPQVKQDVLGVPATTIEIYGVVSEQTARAMAEGVRRLTGSDYAISTTGYAGPGDGPDGQPVGTVWIGIAHPGGSYARKMRFGKLRGPNIERASSTALNLLRLYLEGQPDAPVAGGIF